MSRTPVRTKPEKSSTGQRSFARRRKQEHDRQARRRTTGASGPTGLWDGLRSLVSRVPRIAWICVLIAVLNATAWSIITPPFQGRDEVDHFAYVAHLAETGKSPERIPGPYNYSEQESKVMEGLHYFQVRFTPYQPSISSVAQQEILEEDAASNLSMYDAQANGASSEPPLFYALQTIPFSLAGKNLLIKLQLMRLLDVLFGGVTALLIFLFLRETVPGVPWAASIAAICIALMPLLAFVTGSLNPDALLYPESALVFLMLARGFRRELTLRRATVLGLAIAAGLLTYFSFIGVAIGALAALVVMAIRDGRSRGFTRKTLSAPALAFGIGAAPAVIYGLDNLARGRPLLGAASPSSSRVTEVSISLWDKVSYVWELFLPRLPGMVHYFNGISTWREIWFDRSVGLYGWMDTMFPNWVQNVALILAIVVLALVLRALYLSRRQVRGRLPELFSYAMITVALLAELGLASVSSDLVEGELAYGEPRYLLPLLPLFAAAIALAIRGGGKRLVPVIGAAMVVLFLGHDLFSQLQVIARYYG